MGVWGRYAGARKQLVRTVFDVYRGVEHRLSPSIAAPPPGFRGTGPIERAEVSEPYVAMTFDDGPDPVNTPRLLDILAARGVKATFYVIGEPATVYPDVVRQTLAEGHEVGSHTWSHRFLTTQTSHSIARELIRTEEAVEDAIGVPPASLRPPYGAVTRRMTRWIDHQFGYPTVLWSVSARDWENPGPELITERLLAGTTAGSIVLNHDPLTDTVDAMSQTLDRLLDRGFRFVTVSELIELGAG
ncbi:MAG TPA: polysaccharide deacetylase family protein [Acidimicrobiia bacterium]|nr:polysaccharide deacetylase family protein [Acidimicrobiia bacterium]